MDQITLLPLLSHSIIDTYGTRKSAQDGYYKTLAERDFCSVTVPLLIFLHKKQANPKQIMCECLGIKRGLKTER